MTYEPPPNYVPPPNYDPPPQYSQGPIGAYAPTPPAFNPYGPPGASMGPAHAYRNNKPRRSRRRLPLLIVAGLVVLGGLGGGAYALFGGSSSPSMIAVTGQMDLTDTSDEGSFNANCSGVGGYSDISGGAEVVITDDSGKTLAITSLEGGSAANANECDFQWSAAVPAGKTFYGVTISHRGTVKFTEAEMRSGPVTSLGN